MLNLGVTSFCCGSRRYQNTTQIGRSVGRPPSTVLTNDRGYDFLSSGTTLQTLPFNPNPEISSYAGRRPRSFLFPTPFLAKVESPFRWPLLIMSTLWSTPELSSFLDFQTHSESRVADKSRSAMLSRLLSWVFQMTTRIWISC